MRQTPTSSPRTVAGVRLFDAFRGPHFTALAYGPHAAAELANPDWPAAGAELKRLVITGGGGDGVFTDRPETSPESTG